MTEPQQDVQRLWRDQPREEHAMSIDEIRSKADRLERTVRRRNIATAVLIVLIVIVEGWQIYVERELLERLGDALTIAAFVYMAYLFRDYVSAESMPAGLGYSSSVDFYRRQLVQQRDAAAHPWRYLTLFIPGVTLSLFSDALTRTPQQNAAIAFVAIALFATVAWVHTRSARRLQEEIDGLG
jgi:hypothetical protein